MDELVREITAGIVVETFKRALGGFAKLKDWLTDKRIEIGLLEKAEGRFLTSLERSLSYTNLLGKPDPVSIRSTSVKVNYIRGVSRYKQLSVHDMESAYDHDRRKLGSIFSTLPGDQLIKNRRFIISNDLLATPRIPSKIRNDIKKLAGSSFSGYTKFRIEIYKLLETHNFTELLTDLFEEPQKYIVLGKPGSGKTTFLKQLALQAIDGELEEPIIPIFISLIEYSESRDEEIFDYVVSTFFDSHGFPESREFVVKILNSGGALLLFDGLDEVPLQSLSRTIREVELFTRKYLNNPVVISCRVAAYDQYFNGFRELELADFDEPQIEAFSRKWFLKESDSINFLAQLNNNRGILELCSNPLLMTLVCIAFEEARNAMPVSKADLYEEAFEALMRKWDAKRKITRERSPRHISKRTLYFALQKIAASLFEENIYFFEKRKLERLLEQSLYMGHETTLEETDLLISDVEADHGIWLERAKGIFSFSHLSIQEFLTAKFICENAKEGKTGILVKSVIADQRWNEVFLLVSQMLTEPGDLLRRFQSEIVAKSKQSRIDELVIEYCRKCKIDYEKACLKDKIRILAACANSMFLRGNSVSSKYRNRSKGANSLYVTDVYDLSDAVIQIINSHKNLHDVDGISNILERIDLDCELFDYCSSEYFSDSRVNELKRFIELNIILYKCFHLVMNLTKAKRIDFSSSCFSLNLLNTPIDRFKSELVP